MVDPDDAAAKVGCESRRAAAPASWSELQRQFMSSRGFALHYPGVHLCRRKGDTSVTLASGADVAKLWAGMRN